MSYLFDPAGDPDPAGEPPDLLEAGEELPDLAEPGDDILECWSLVLKELKQAIGLPK